MAIYDCFLFSDELDLLEIRLQELRDVVDRFVLVESAETHAGHPKPLHYREHCARFADFADRIIPVTVTLTATNPFQREIEQRNAIVQGLDGAKDGDLILTSDADEIISAAALTQYLAAPHRMPARAEQYFSYYYVNCHMGNWCGTRVTPFSLFRKRPEAHLWRNSEPPDTVTLPQAGWHFSYLGGVHAMQQKLASFHHQDLNRAPFNDARYLRVMSAIGGDLYLRSDHSARIIPVDDTFPTWLRRHPERFAHLIHHGEFNEDWCGASAIATLIDKLTQVLRDPRTSHADADILEFGCREGRSTVALAIAAFPAKVTAVDTWEGNRNEDSQHVTVTIAGSRDVRSVFSRNINNLTDGNVIIVQRDCHEFMEEHRRRIRFVHIDASHDYDSVARTIDAVRARIIRGGVICGHDFLTASADRNDLQRGVERAVRERLPGFGTEGNLWYWRAP